MLVDITERKRAEEALARHSDEQSALYQFTDSLFRAGSPSDVYDAALDAIERALGCERASILLFDASGVDEVRRLARTVRRLSSGGRGPFALDARRQGPAADLPSRTSEAADLPEFLDATVTGGGHRRAGLHPAAGQRRA